MSACVVTIERRQSCRAAEALTQLASNMERVKNKKKESSSCCACVIIRVTYVLCVREGVLQVHTYPSIDAHHIQSFSESGAYTYTYADQEVSGTDTSFSF